MVKTHTVKCMPFYRSEALYMKMIQYFTTFVVCLLFSSLTALESTIAYERFPTESRKLSEIKQRAAELKLNNCEEGERLSKTITKQFLSYLKQAEKEGKAHDFSANLAYFSMQNKKPEDPIINASAVKMGEDRNYILFSCPDNAIGAGILFDIALEKGISLFVTTLESTDASNKFNHFWKNEKLARIKSRNGWKIINIHQHILATAEKEPEGTNTPQIIESTLLAIRLGETRILTHLHYDGWRDRQAMPSETLFYSLQNRIMEHQKEQNAPFAINCYGGVGRTGTTALSHYLRKEVDTQLALGKKLDEIEVNIPELLFQFRLQRNYFLQESGQLANVYSVLGDYYEELRVLFQITGH